FYMELIDFILHIDQYLQVFLQDYGVWFYAILFLIIFVENGLVVMPFLPGDLLLFATGMLAAQFPEILYIWLVIIILLIAAGLGDTMNYIIGKENCMQIVNFKIFSKQPVKKKHIEKTLRFYEKYRSNTIVIARFVPIVRTLEPFVAGIGRMNYITFLTYNVLGGFIWVFGFTLFGYFLGIFPIFKNNFSKLLLLIIFI